jgi:hypothetical protein
MAKAIQQLDKLTRSQYLISITAEPECSGATMTLYKTPGHGLFGTGEGKNEATPCLFDHLLV